MIFVLSTMMRVRSSALSLPDLVKLCRRRGFIFPGSDIYGGLASTYDYGPLGVQLKKNVVDSWWSFFVERKADVVGIDSSICTLLFGRPQGMWNRLRIRSLSAGLAKLGSGGQVWRMMAFLGRSCCAR